MAGTHRRAHDAVEQSASAGDRGRQRAYLRRRICTQFIKLGLGGCDIGVSYTLPRIVGAGQVFDLILTARTVEADEALRIGLVSRVSAGSVLDEALAIAETLCGYGKFGLESTKQVLWANPEAPSLQAALHVENRSQILSLTSGELKEATEKLAGRAAAVDDHHRARDVAACVRTQ